MHIKDALEDNSIVPAGHGLGNIAWLVEKFEGPLTLEPHLKVFKGLANLEEGDNLSEVGRYNYKTNDEAFDAAVTELNKLL